MTNTVRDLSPTTHLRTDATMGDGKSIGFDVSIESDRPACFALGVRKSGSSLFSNLVGALAEHNARNTVDIPGTMFEHGYRYRDWNKTPVIEDLVWRGNIYIGFRDAPTALYRDPVFQKAKKLLLVRDPRDALVSEYFSNAYSHSLPKDEAENSVIAKERAAALQSDLSDYIMSRVKALDATVHSYSALLKSPTLKVMRYEDVIFEKADWLRDIAAHFDMDAPETLINDILGWADIRPDAEDKTAFVRRVAPGDHKDKLTPDTIRAVEEKLSKVWRDLGYEFG